jgi:hypothetical protein
METFFLDEGWYPFTVLVVFDQLIFNICNLDEPAIECSINQGSLRSPAIWITMDNCT